MTVAEILDANRGPHGWDRSRAESAINEALELAAQEAEKFEKDAIERTELALATGRTVAECNRYDAQSYSGRTLAARIRALKSPATPQEP